MTSLLGINRILTVLYQWGNAEEIFSIVDIPLQKTNRTTGASEQIDLRSKGFGFNSRNSGHV